MKEIKIKPIGYIKNNVKELRFGNFVLYLSNYDELESKVKLPKWTKKFIYK